ncbi:MAG TPA: hypothetical protein PLD55_07675 [bacterium]|jgi:hypothetical protein|nr:hypothetical protein [bacterium]HOG43080.1 hypothetical protein [bacterium]HPY14470.1 hypothetical protein [bacterium]HQB10063.1 hypothetical protein [bacterium]HQM84545.1 hypothetical protein [bacterium]
MSFNERKVLYKQLMDIRNCPVIAYVTSGRPNATGNIAQDAIRQFIKQLELLPNKPVRIDLIINSYGGDGLTSWRLITMLREYLGQDGKITCFVPYYAFSAATLIAVGCDEIFLHPLASLGPVDPQITVNKKDGPQQFAYEDVSAYTSFLKEEAGITEQKEKVSLLSQLVNQIEPSVIGASKRASMQSIIMAEKLLKLHMKGSDSQNAEVIAQKLSKNYFSHGHAVSKNEANDLGLKISESNESIENIIWNIYKDFEEEMKMCELFDPTADYLSDPRSAFLLDPPPIVNIPSNTPPQLAQQIWNNVLQSTATNQGPVLDFELKHAAIESFYHSEQFITNGKIIGSRLPDLNYRIGTPKLSSGWKEIN